MEEGQALRGGFKVENGLDSDVEFIPEDDDYIPEPVDAIHFVKVENCESTCELNGGGCENVTEDIRAEENCDENNTGLDGIDKRLYVKLDKIDAHQEVQKNKKGSGFLLKKNAIQMPALFLHLLQKVHIHPPSHNSHDFGRMCQQEHALPIHCEFETRLFTSLEKHSVSHKNTRTNKIYKCEVCGYEVKKLSGISRHVVTHSKSKKLRCNLCRYKTNRKDSLVQHLKKHKERAKKEELK
ncbi:hypothetical protein NQ317_008248 [Molorchus minor]|uniref:C2H2-type domain-containing protein n=1 Tax=Molorchus minor TaxID=1323400 RepID=A0ABQ9J0B4_9CUCU|nr:hypothetical protein NQ317_008248 [Molorchus minor]